MHVFIYCKRLQGKFWEAWTKGNHQGGDMETTWRCKVEECIQDYRSSSGSTGLHNHCEFCSHSHGLTWYFLCSWTYLKTFPASLLITVSGNLCLFACYSVYCKLPNVYTPQWNVSNNWQENHLLDLVKWISISLALHIKQFIIHKLCSLQCGWGKQCW